MGDQGPDYPQTVTESSSCLEKKQPDGNIAKDIQQHSPTRNFKKEGLSKYLMVQRGLDDYNLSKDDADQKMGTGADGGVPSHTQSAQTVGQDLTTTRLIKNKSGPNGKKNDVDEDPLDMSSSLGGMEALRSLIASDSTDMSNDPAGDKREELLRHYSNTESNKSSSDNHQPSTKDNRDCPYCSKTLTSVGEYEIHLKMHTGDKPYLCSICGSSFREGLDLKRHMRFHRGQHVHTCSFCGESFKRSNQLATHMREHLAKELEQGIGRDMEKEKKSGDEKITFNQSSEKMKVDRKFYKEMVKRSRDESFSNSAITNDIEHDEISEDDEGDEAYIDDDDDDMEVEALNLSCKKTDTCQDGDLHSLNDSEDNTDISTAAYQRENMNEKGQFQCKKCTMVLPSAILLKKHGRTHYRKKPYECSICSMTFCSCSNLITHIRTHTGERPFKCKLCDKSFGKNSTLTRHMKCHTGEKPHVCEICDKAFIQKCQLTVHMRTHTGDKPYACSMCDKSFCVKDQLRVHMGTHEEESLECPKCGEVFNKQRLLTSHMRTHSADAEDLSMNHVDKSAVEEKPCPKEKPYRCTECNGVFRTPSSLNLHVRSHTGEKPYQCPICQAAFSINSNLRSHMKIHSEERNFKCGMCDKGFIKSQDLKRHMRCHTGERPHVCPFCDKSFSQNCILKTHMRIHTGERPHCCTLCDKSFCQKSQLQNHMRVHDVNRPYTCNDCGKNFRESGTFESHMRIHTGEKPFECSVCSKTFRQSGYLQKHMKSHSGDKPHKCLVCFTSYLTIFTLHRHMKTHTGEQPYICLVCNWEFQTNHLLKDHMKSHTTEGTSPPPTHPCDDVCMTPTDTASSSSSIFPPRSVHEEDITSQPGESSASRVLPHSFDPDQGLPQTQTSKSNPSALLSTSFLEQQMKAFGADFNRNSFLPNHLSDHGLKTSAANFSVFPSRSLGEQLMKTHTSKPGLDDNLLTNNQPSSFNVFPSSDDSSKDPTDPPTVAQPSVYSSNRFDEKQSMFPQTS